MFTVNVIYPVLIIITIMLQINVSDFLAANDINKIP